MSATNWEDAYRLQTEAIKELRAENAALREDKERLDWMEQYQKKLGVWPGYSYRAEIDARRKKAQR